MCWSKQGKRPRGNQYYIKENKTASLEIKSWFFFKALIKNKIIQEKLQNILCLWAKIGQENTVLLFVIDTKHWRYLKYVGQNKTRGPEE
jgi:hypothetical protein